MSCIQGKAGTGKSFVLNALRELYENSGYVVRGLAPTNEVVKSLEKDGFKKAQSLHRLLFINKHNRSKLGRKEVWIVDESSMVGNKVFQEILKLAWINNNQLILVGDNRQLSPIERGGLFGVFCERYNASNLSGVQRQEKEWSRDVTTKLSQGKTSDAINQLVEKKAIYWSDSRDESMISLVKKWFVDQKMFSTQTSFILEHRNHYANILNEMIHQVRKDNNEINKEEFECETFLGRCRLSEGDRVQFRGNKSDLKITNGLLGTLIKANKSKFTVKTDLGEMVEFNPQKFCKYQLGYAGTYHRSQGKTVDRSYVMHSPWINQNLFYVGLTRHRKNV